MKLFDYLLALCSSLIILVIYIMFWIMLILGFVILSPIVLLKMAYDYLFKFIKGG